MSDMDDAKLTAAAEGIETALRSLGLFRDSHRWLVPQEEGKGDDQDRHGANPKSPILMMNLMVGDLAFSTRVQDVAQKTMDDEFREMAAGFRRQEFDDIKKDIENGNGI